jgi:glycosyltransferase involved in cell wall biosynthesis
MLKKLNVLFMQSQTYFGADSRIHQVLLEHFNRERINVYCACNAGSTKEFSDSYKALQKVHDLHLRPTNFGVSVNERAKKEIVSNMWHVGIPSFVDLNRLGLYVRKNKINIIHCTEKPRDTFYGLLLARITGAKCVIHMHVKAEDWISLSVQWSMKHADGLIGVSSFVADSIIEMGYDPKKTYYALNGMDISAWDPDIDGSEVRQEFNINPSQPLLAVVSRLFYWKGHVDLLNALAKVKLAMPDVRLLLVGEDDPRGTPGRGSFTEELKDLVAKLDIGDNVIFTGFRSDIPKIMSACDIFTMPSYEEPFGMVYLEAMAMKKPIIALDNGGAREVVEHGKSGLLSPHQDIDQLTKNIVTLIQNPELRIKMGDYGRHRAESYFTPQRMTNDVENVYWKIMGLVPPNQILDTV